MDEFGARINMLVKLIKTCKSPIILSGAGLSTNSGIPDYRSGLKTTSSGKFWFCFVYEFIIYLAGPGIMNFKNDPSFWPRVLESRK